MWACIWKLLYHNIPHPHPTTDYPFEQSENNTHIGRHDLVEKDPELRNADLLTRIHKAQELQEESFIEIIKSHSMAAPRSA